MNIKMCLTFASLAFLICLFTVYNASITEQRIKMINESVSANYFRSQSEERIEELKGACDFIVHEDTFKQHNYNSDIYTCFGWGSYDLKSSYITMYIDGEEHPAYKDITMDSMAEPECGFFHENDYKSLKHIYGYDSFYLAGTNPQNADEIALAEHMLEAYRLTADDIIGKTISGYMKNNLHPESGDIFQFEGTVCGIIRGEYYSLPGHAKNNNASPVLLFHRDHEFFRNKYITMYRMFLDDWPDEETTLEWFVMAPNTYAVLTYVAKIDSLTSIQTLASNVYIIIGSTLIVSLILTIFLMIDKYIKVLSRFGGILLSAGLPQNKLSLLLLVQLLILCVFAMPLAFILTFGGYYVINTLIRVVTKISLALSAIQIVTTLFIGISIVIIIALTFFAYGLFHMRKKTIKQLLTVTVD